MTKEKDLSHIAKAIALANAKGNAVPSKFSGLLDDLKQEALADKLVDEQGVITASTRDIEDETNGWTPSEEVDFDQDENLVDMDSVSLSMRQVFES